MDTDAFAYTKQICNFQWEKKKKNQWMEFSEGDDF